MDESIDSYDHTDNLIQGAVEALSESFEEMDSERAEFAGQARRHKFLNGFFNVLIVLLSVAAPIVVTYMTLHDNPSMDLMRNTIILVAITGALAILRSVLRPGEKYGYAVMTAMKLRELESNAKMEMEEILHTTKDVLTYGKLSALNREVQESWTDIIQKHLASGGSGGEG
ncbi:MAG: hypothetical protein C0600_15750 [Ignavibacteria bacterium]|nr:MAG: hypothetical protein C0600_15750 [Ignavibacteria bacterium]